VLVYLDSPELGAAYLALDDGLGADFRVIFFVLSLILLFAQHTRHEPFWAAVDQMLVVLLARDQLFAVWAFNGIFKALGVDMLFHVFPYDLNAAQSTFHHHLRAVLHVIGYILSE
jgi:hypothetical protein